MACCNNECLENINGACVDYTGAEFTCLTNGDSLTIETILQNIDTLLCANINNEITVDLKCINNNCSDTLPYSLTLVKDVSSSITISVALTTYITTVKIYTGSELITSVTSLANPITIPTTYINTTGVTVVIDIITDTGVSYSGSFFISPTAASGVYTSTLPCQTNSVVTTTVTTIIASIINKICDLQNQINVLNG